MNTLNLDKLSSVLTRASNSLDRSNSPTSQNSGYAGQVPFETTLGLVYHACNTQGENPNLASQIHKLLGQSMPLTLKKHIGLGEQFDVWAETGNATTNFLSAAQEYRLINPRYGTPTHSGYLLWAYWLTRS